MTRSRLDTPLGIKLSAETAARARALVAGLRGTPEALDGGLSGLIEQALERELRRLERAHNGGQRFPDVERLPKGPGV
ncbi:MAG: hypothetical protein FWE71_07610 [Nocardioidaceae bacterium]|nr:hypothetical protein [Nocardioidaceae bacterium]MCL2611854.1 hypothetical protein [Nocardioidaceae bacterium]